jgi:hypothetical protein
LNINLDPIVGRGRDTGVPGGALLLDFAEALIGTDRAVLDKARDALAAGLSPAAVSGASVMAANFSKNDRIANGCGIPVAGPALESTVDIRAQLGLNDYRSAINTFRHT